MKKIILIILLISISAITISSVENNNSIINKQSTFNFKNNINFSFINNDFAKPGLWATNREMAFLL